MSTTPIRDSCTHFEELLASYRFAQTVKSNLEAECRRDNRGSGENTVKSLRRCIRQTPFAAFQRAQLVLLDQLAHRLGCETSLSMPSVRLSVATLAHGILVSGGCRRSEICHLREGEQTSLLSGSRDVRLRAVDRKNRSAHDFVLRERWLPEWFLHHYLNTVRPALLRKAALPPGLPRSFLLLRPYSGAPYGCVEEAEDGTGRVAPALVSRMNMLSNLWLQHVSAAFREAGLPVPTGRQQFSMHVVRNVGGHAVFVHRGLEAAAHFLGDRVATVEGTYAALKGELVDTSLLE